MNNKEIIVRRATIKDAESIAKVWRTSISQGETKYTNTINFDQRKYKRLKEGLKDKKNNFTFVATNKDDKKVVLGICGFQLREKVRTRKRIEIGWLVHPEHYKKGIATKLLKHLIKTAKSVGIKKIEAEIITENIASLKLALKCGFQIEGLKKKSMILDSGKMTDVYVIGKRV